MAGCLHKLGCRCAGALTFFALLVLLLYPLALCMQAARNAEPPDMAKAIRKKEALRDAKRNKLEKAMKQDAAATKAGETASAGSIDDRKAKIQVCSIALLMPVADIQFAHNLNHQLACWLLFYLPCS